MKKSNFACLLLLMLMLWATTTKANNISPSISFAAWVNYANINYSFIQIPAGGAPGSTSANRPTFDQLGIKNNTNYNIRIHANWDVWGVYSMYNYNRPKGHSVLSQNLLTHSLYLPAGTAVSANTRFDLYRLGLTYNLALSNKQWQIYPLAEGTLLAFNYNLQSSAATTQRGFNQATVRFGIGGKYHFTPKLVWDFEVASSIPRMLNLDVKTANTHLDYSIFQTQSQSTSIFAGIAYTRIDFTDRQTVPNHICLVEWPSSEIGLQVTLL